MMTARPGQEPQLPPDIKPIPHKISTMTANATIEIITIDQEIVQMSTPTLQEPPTFQEPPTQENRSENLVESMTSPSPPAPDNLDSHLEKTFQGVLTDLAVFEDTQPEIKYNDWLVEQTRISESTLGEVSTQVQNPEVFQALQSHLFKALKETQSFRHAEIELMKQLAEFARSQVQVLISSQTWSEQVSFDWVTRCKSPAEVLALMQDSAVTKLLLKFYSSRVVRCREMYNEEKVKHAEVIFAVIEAVRGYQKGMEDKLKHLGPCSDEAVETWHSECIQAVIGARKEALDRELERVWEMLIGEARKQFQIGNEAARLAEEEQKKVRLAEAEIKRNRLAEQKRKAIAESQGLATKYHEASRQRLSDVILYSQTELVKIHDQVKNKVLGDFNTKYGHVMELDFEATGATLDAEFDKVKAAELQKKDDLNSRKSTSAKASRSTQDLTRKSSTNTEKADHSRRQPADTEKKDPSRRTSSDTKIKDQGTRHSTEASKHESSSSSKTSRRTSESDRKRKSRSRSPSRKADRQGSTRTSSSRQRDEPRTRDRSRTPTRRRSRSRSRDKAKEDKSQRARTTASSTKLENTKPKSADASSSSTSKKAEPPKSSTTAERTLKPEKADHEPPLKSNQAPPTTSEPLYDRRPRPAPDAAPVNKQAAAADEKPLNPPKLQLSQPVIDAKPEIKLEPGTSEAVASGSDLKPAPQQQIPDNRPEALPVEPLLSSNSPTQSNMLNQLKQQLQARAKATETKSVSQTTSSGTANRKPTLSATQQAILDKCTGRSSSTAPPKSEQPKSVQAVGGNAGAKTDKVPSCSKQNSSKRLSTESAGAPDTVSIPAKRVCAAAVSLTTAVPAEHQLSSETAGIQASPANILPPPLAQQSSLSSSVSKATTAASDPPRPPSTVTDPKPTLALLPTSTASSGDLKRATTSPTTLCLKPDTAVSTASSPVAPMKIASTNSRPVNSISILMGENKFYVESHIEGIKTPVVTHDPIFYLALDPATAKIMIPRPGQPKEAINVIDGLINSETLDYHFYQKPKVKIFVDKLVGLYFTLEVIRKHSIKAELLPTIHVRVAVPAVLPSGGRHQLKNGLKIAGFTKVSLEESPTLVQIPTAIAIGQSQNLTEGGTKEAFIIVTHLRSTSVESALIRITPSGVVETKTSKALDTTSFNGANVFSLVSAANLAKRAKIDLNAITRKFLFVDPAAVDVYEKDRSNNKRHKMEWARLHNPGVVLAGLRRITEVYAGARTKSPKELYQEKFPYSVCIDPENQNNRWIAKRDDDTTEIPKKLRHSVKPTDPIRIMTYFGEQERTKLEVVQASAFWNNFVADQSPGILPSVEVSLDSEGLIRLWIDKEDRRFIKTRVHYMYGDCVAAAAEIKQILAYEPQVPQLANPSSANTSPSGR